MGQQEQPLVSTLMPEVQIIPNKAALRDAARKQRSSFSPAQIEAMSVLACTHLTELIDGIDPLMIYVSKPLEVHTHTLLASLLSHGKRVVVPIIEKETKTLRLSYLSDTAHLVESTFQVPEPIGHELTAHAEDIRAVVVPVLAFDRGGHRLGYGAGYYDRFLARYPHLTKIGLAFSCQQIPSVPHDANDIRMDFIITEKGVLDCRK
jgi:5-formyltetrahydrofolate cyclo-ligase